MLCGARFDPDHSFPQALSPPEMDQNCNLQHAGAPFARGLHHDEQHCLHSLQLFHASEWFRESADRHQHLVRLRGASEHASLWRDLGFVVHGLPGVMQLCCAESPCLVRFPCSNVMHSFSHRPLSARCLVVWHYPLGPRAAPLYTCYCCSQPARLANDWAHGDHADFGFDSSAFPSVECAAGECGRCCILQPFVDPAVHWHCSPASTCGKMGQRGVGHLWHRGGTADTGRVGGGGAGSCYTGVPQSHLEAGGNKDHQPWKIGALT
mmetsp:Transcript_72982/g.161105  ORF Transcript_72982/g.161105 Transcript_72982/m.161105 type:complete len:265 (+) Transcript_72982:2284-3078(+)